MNLEYGKEYKWKHDNKVLVYVGFYDGWHRFTHKGELWCEVVESDLVLMEVVE